MRVRWTRSAGQEIEDELRSDLLVLGAEGSTEAEERAWAAFCLTQQFALPPAALPPLPDANSARPVDVIDVESKVIPSPMPTLEASERPVIEAPRPVRPFGGDAREAAILFRQTVVALSRMDDDADTRPEARQCAMALLQLAGSGEEDLLAAHLRPHPGKSECTWTVACYQIGDLSPTSLRDFPEAVTAVAHLADCENRSHVAAELIAASGDGVRWTALVRSGAEVRFQPFDKTTATADTPTLVRGARRAWENRLQRWGRDPAADLAIAAVGPAVPTESRAPDPAIGLILTAVTRIEARLSVDDGLAARIAELEAAQRAATAEIAALRAELAQVTPAAGSRKKHARRAHRRLGWLM